MWREDVVASLIDCLLHGIPEKYDVLMHFGGSLVDAPSILKNSFAVVFLHNLLAQEVSLNDIVAIKRAIICVQSLGTSTSLLCQQELEMKVLRDFFGSYVVSF